MIFALNALSHNAVDFTKREPGVFESVEQIAFVFINKPKPIFGFLLRFSFFGGPFPAFPHIALRLGETVRVARFWDADAASFVDPVGRFT